MTPDHLSWTSRLQSVLDAATGPIKHIVLFSQTDSTQDAARRLHAPPGHVIIAARQTAGRGRMGRQWADTQNHGIAATFILPRPPDGRLAIAGAVAAAQAAESLLQRDVGIKWPNDVLIDSRKLAGVLVEQFDDRALVGIGMNITQTTWPAEIAHRAISLRQLGSPCTREDALAHLLQTANHAFTLNPDQLTTEFAARDVLIGQTATFNSAGSQITGTVLRIDPLQGLLIDTTSGQRWLNANTTTLLSPSPRPDERVM